MVVPFVNYWWPSFPDNLSTEAFRMLPQPDQWTFRVAHYAPWLFYKWMTQKWFPSLTLTNIEMFSVSDDIGILKNSESQDSDQVTTLICHFEFEFILTLYILD